MPKALTRPALALFAALFCAQAAAAQTTLEWIVLAPTGEAFTARAPKEALSLEQDVRADELVTSGRRYTATAEGGVRYVVWSLADTNKVGDKLKANGRSGNLLGELRYLDLVAEVAWEFLVTPEFERLEVERARTGESKQFIPGMNLRREFKLGGRHAREYLVRLEKEGGPVYVCTDGERVYIVAALAPDPEATDSKRFVESFALKTLPDAEKPPPLGVPASTATLPANTGSGDATVDYNKPFKQAEVTKKALITLKPEPSFTEGARKFNVTGVVRLRAILSKTGEMTNISVVKYLPHGLTEKAIAAARQIRFTPAQKDGQAVSQYVVLEYNFNIY